MPFMASVTAATLSVLPWPVSGETDTLKVCRMLQQFSQNVCLCSGLDKDDAMPAALLHLHLSQGLH